MKKSKIQKFYNFGSVAAIIILLIMNFSKGKFSSESGLFDLLKELTPNNDVVLRVDTVRTVDTLYKVKEKIVYQEKIKYVDRFLPAPPEKEYRPSVKESVNVYAGETSPDSLVTLGYKITVQGKIVDMQLGYKFDQPTILEKTITETIHKTETITKELYRGGFYVGTGVRYSFGNSKPLPSFNAAYLFRKGYYLSYGFEPASKSHLVTFQKRLF